MTRKQSKVGVGLRTDAITNVVEVDLPTPIILTKSLVRVRGRGYGTT